MPFHRTRTFRSGNSQAVRIPGDIAFAEGTELIVIRAGDVLTLYPAKASVAEMLRELARLPAPPDIEERDTGDLPERPGL